jgi:hypothetical protein
MHPLTYLDCPSCRARFHTGAIYEPLELCPRCGTPLNDPRPGIMQRLSALIGRRKASEVLDWERVTGSQYATRHLRRSSDEGTPPTG